MPRSTKSKIEHVKVVNPARGGTYYYFDTGQTKPSGAKVYAKLPDLKSPDFWQSYAGYKAGRTKRDNAASVLMLSGLISLYRKGEKYKKLKPNSKKKYEIYLRQIDAAFKGANADGLERKDMMLLIDDMADRPAAANLLLSVASALYSWARTRGHVSARPCDDIDVFEMGEHQPWPDELVKLGLASDDALVKLGVHLLYYTGQRIGDVSMMRWSDVREGRIEITQEKTGKRVSIPPHPELRAVLDITPKAGLTILARNAKPISRVALRDHLKAFAADHGYKIVPHGLRKNAVNALLESGCSTAETSAITAQSLQIVEHYAKARDTRVLADSAILKWSKVKK